MGIYVEHSSPDTFNAAIYFFPACTKMNTCMVLSSLSTMNIEEVAESSGNGLRWLQLYLFKDKALVTKLIVRAESAGYKALVITVDHPALQGGKVFHHFRVPKHLSIANFVCTKETLPSMLDPSHTWETIDWLQGITKLPIIIKGILTFEDAQEALKHNVRGIIVSNHGGRQLDGVPATVSGSARIKNAIIQPSSHTCTCFYMYTSPPLPPLVCIHYM